MWKALWMTRRPVDNCPECRPQAPIELASQSDHFISCVHGYANENSAKTKCSSSVVLCASLSCVAYCSEGSARSPTSRTQRQHRHALQRALYRCRRMEQAVVCRTHHMVVALRVQEISGHSVVWSFGGGSTRFHYKSEDSTICAYCGEQTISGGASWLYFRALLQGSASNMRNRRYARYRCDADHDGLWANFGFRQCVRNMFNGVTQVRVRQQGVAGIRGKEKKTLGHRTCTICCGMRGPAM